MAVLVLLSLGVQDIRLGPKLRGSVSPNVLKTLVEYFNNTASATVEEGITRLVPA